MDLKQADMRLNPGRVQRRVVSWPKRWSAQPETRWSGCVLLAFFCLQGLPAAADCITFGDTGFVLSVDDSWYDSFEIHEWDGTTELILNPHSRIPATISLGPPDATETTDSAVLTNGMTLAYRTETVEVGSGGPEADLYGILNTEPPLGVRCWLQNEFWPNPEWCLEPIGTLRATAEGCGVEGE